MSAPAFRPALLSARDAAPDARLLRFTSPKNFRFTPGQFLILSFADEPKTSRAYSICSSPAAAEEYFEVTARMAGAFPERLGALKPGREGGLIVRGPYGKWVYDGTIPHAVLVAGGTGLAPLRAMCLLKTETGLANKITLCCSAKTPEHLLYRAEYGDWRKNGINVEERVTRPESDSNWGDKTGRWAADAVLAAANDAEAVYFLCGPNGMVQELREGLQTLGVPPRNLRTEKWNDYAGIL
ncbi:MAG: FAD-dependent oxidoreductase [Elusimicrobia bacterium]|nr:FAD-dependent oxidoreductase [Elusimicrobiota bacterium]